MIEKLKQLLTEKSAEYDGLGDEDAAKLANQKRHPGARSIGVLELAGMVGEDTAKRLAKSVDWITKNDNDRKEIYEILVGLVKSGQAIDVNHPLVRGAIARMVAAPDAVIPLNQTDADKILALADNLRSDAELYGIGQVRHGDMIVAREVKSG